MGSVLSLLSHLLPVLYAAAWVNYGVYFFRDDPFARRTATPFLAATAAAHLLYVVLLTIEYEHHPMASAFEVFNVVALALVLVYLAVEVKQGNKSTGLFILPVVFLLQLASSVWISPTRTIHSILRDPLFGLHTGSVALGYAAFFLSAVYGVMYQMLYRALRTKRFGLIFERLPSLDIMARMTMGAALVGFSFLTLAITFGAAWAVEKIPGFWRDPKFIFTIVVWLIYGASLVSHYVLRLTGRRVVGLALVGFIVMLLSILSTHLFLPGFHQDLGG